MEGHPRIVFDRIWVCVTSLPGHANPDNLASDPMDELFTDDQERIIQIRTKETEFMTKRKSKRPCGVPITHPSLTAMI